MDGIRPVIDGCLPPLRSARAPAVWMKHLATIPVGPRAWWLAFTPDNRFLYVTVGRANELVVIDRKSNSVAARLPAGALPWGIAMVDTE
jgi:YVTN family beta-propeller protein